MRRTTWPKDKMSSLFLPSWVETTLPSEQHSRTTAGAEQLVAEILLNGRRNGNSNSKGAADMDGRISAWPFSSLNNHSHCFFGRWNSSFCPVLKDKLRDMKNCKSLCKQKLIRIGQCPTGVVRSSGKISTEKGWKQSKEMIWWALSLSIALFGKAQVSVCDWLSLGFNYLSLRHCRLGFGLFTWPPRHLSHLNLMASLFD